MFAIGQTVQFKSVRGHVVFVTDDEISVRTDLGGTIPCKPSELTLLSEEALPLQPIGNAPTLTSTPVPKVPGVGTKLACAMDIYKTAKEEGKSRKETIALFVAQLQMTEAGASTYYSMCRHAPLN